MEYVKVILPLKLEWEPLYSTAEPIHVGDRVRVMLSGHRYVGVVSEAGAVPDMDVSRIKPVEGLEKDVPPVGEGEIRLWREIAAYYLCTVGEVYKAAYSSVKVELEKKMAEALRRKRLSVMSRLAARREKLELLLSKKTTETRAATAEKWRAEIEVMEVDLKKLDECGSVCSAGKEVALSEAQKEAVRQVHDGWSAGKAVLLNGVTGSGKTEVYMALAAETLAKGKSVLYLVPEIALSRQLEARVKEVFPNCMTLHSELTPVQRRQVTTSVRASSPYMVLGTRSALFLPHHDLGLVIVDEEHDASYKQSEPAPRYSGRDVAVMLSVIMGCNVVLGSATPSLESLYNAKVGRFAEVRLSERFHDGEEAEVVIIDTVAERRKRGMVGNFSRKLIDEIRKTLSRGEQVVILRARRAYASFLQCSVCGTIVKCPHCNVPMTYHKDTARMVCHYCGHTEGYTGTCHHCGELLVAYGAGTQKIEEEARQYFPEARIERLDSDTPDSRERHVIERFAAGETDILVGTQIVTKGFDFKGLTLVAAIQADGILGVQDFRADERAFQLFEQFRGRSGRRGIRGRLIIQTSQPEHPVYARLKGLEASDTLLQERRLFGYPPYTRMIALIIRDSDPARLDNMSSALCASLPLSTGVTGPYTPVIDRIGGEHIRHIRIALPRDKTLIANKKSINDAISSFEREKHYYNHITVDVDPL